MAQSPSFNKFRRAAVCALAVVWAALAIALAGIAFGSSGRVSYRPPTPSLDGCDIDAKGLRPHQQVAFRGTSRSVRLGSSGTVTDFGVLQCAHCPTTQRVPVPTAQVSGISGYLQQRTSWPRGPPLPVA
jgi:hypothetical protein